MMDEHMSETYEFGCSARAQGTFADPFSLTAALCSARVNAEGGWGENSKSWSSDAHRRRGICGSLEK